jgi:hypothetical protein
MIHLELPRIPDGGIPEVPDARLEMCNISCLPLKGLLRATQRMVTSMQESVSRMLDRINQLIPDIDVNPRDGLRPSRRRATRSLLDFVGSASSYLFGTAIEGEIGELRESIRKIEAMAETAAADASRTRDGLAEFTVELRYNGLGYNVQSVITYFLTWSQQFSMENCTDIAYSDIMYSRLLRTPYLARNGLMASVITYIRHARLIRVTSQHVSITLLNARSTLQVPNRPLGSTFTEYSITDTSLKCCVFIY